MKWTRIGLVVLAVGLLATFFAWPRRQTPDEHRAARQLVLHFTLSRTDDPIVVLGDSIAEASTLPRSHCGHPIVNAGLSGAATGSDLGSWLSSALAGKQAALIVVSLGTNDAFPSRSLQTYQANYGKLLAQLATMASRVVVLAVPPVEARNLVTAEARDQLMRTIDGYNSALPGLASNAGATFMALPPMPDSFTVDGAHLNAAGYSVWDAAVLQAAASICK